MDLPEEKDLLRRKKKSKLDEEIDDLFDYDEDSDFPLTEKKTKEKKIKRV